MSNIYDANSRLLIIICANLFTTLKIKEQALSVYIPKSSSKTTKENKFNTQQQ